MALPHKIYRSAAAWREHILSSLRRLNLRLKYPSLNIDSKTTIGKNCRIICVDGAEFSITNCQLAPNVFIVAEKGATLRITDSSVGPGSVIVAKQHIEIGKYCSIAEMVVIRDQDHDHNSGALLRDSGYITGKIVLGENVWIGAKATVLKNVSVGNNAVIGAHSLVNKNIPDNAVFAGIPAKLIRQK